MTDQAMNTPADLAATGSLAYWETVLAARRQELGSLSRIEGVASPRVTFWKAIFNAQTAAKKLEKLNEGPKNKKAPKTFPRDQVNPVTGEVTVVLDFPPMWLYVSGEQYIEELRRVCHPQGLVVWQESVLDDPDPTYGKYNAIKCKIGVVHAESNTGRYFNFDFPLENATAGEKALTKILSYFTRGFLLIPRVDAQDEAEGEPAPLPQSAPAFRPTPPPQQPPPQLQQQPGLPPAGSPGPHPNTVWLGRLCYCGAPQFDGYAGKGCPQGHFETPVKGAPPVRPVAPAQPPAPSPQQPVYATQTDQQQFVPPPQQQPIDGPPIDQEPIVNFARATLGDDRPGMNGHSVPVHGGPRTGEPQTMDQWRAKLVELGWGQEIATHLAGLTPDEGIGDALVEEISNVALSYYNGDYAKARHAWTLVGFNPQPGLPAASRPRPVGAQVQRYCALMDLTERTETPTSDQ